MTDREPDDLYDALRDRLADYGQEPPAPLWARIRAQLPPPVAAPQLRRRRWRRAALLGLLLVLIGVGTWSRWHTGRNWPGAAGNNAAIIVNKNTNNQPNNKPQDDPSEAVKSAAGYSTENHLATKDAIASTSGQTAGATPDKPAATLAATAGPARDARSPVARPAPGAGKNGAAAIGRARGPQGLLAGQPGYDDAKSATHMKAATAEATRGMVARTRSAAWGPRSAGRNQLGELALTNDAAAKTHEPDAAAGALASPAAARRMRRRTDGRAGTLAVARRRASKTTKPFGPQLPLGREAAPARQRASRPPDSAESARANADPTANTAASFAAWNRLQPRTSKLLQAPTPPPATLASADTLLRPLRVARPRWAVQVLAGPALTYRQLGAASSPVVQAAPTPFPSSAPTNTFYNQAGQRTSIAAQERPSAGVGVQVQVQRVLNGRWTLSAGLGYQEYATKLNLQLVPANASAIPPITSTPRITDSTQIRTAKLRDTYRFLTVPVRLGYWLGPESGRFRGGLLGGADIALYLGGATTEGNPCGCTSQTWGATGSPYRAASLALSLGADLRYRLGPRWEVLAQPTATYFLTSLAQPTSGFTPRYLLGGSTLLGISYGWQ